MGTYPIKPRSAFLSWVAEHAELWAAEAESIGLSEADASAMAEALAQAQAAANEQGIAQNAAKAATLAANSRIRELQAIVARNVSKIRVRAAEASGEEHPSSICARAAIDSIAPRTATPAPGRPFGFRAELLSTGGLALSWRCRNPGNVGGVIYEIERRAVERVGEEPESFERIGTSGERSFIDRTLPSGFGGAASVVYRITPARSTRRGTAAEFIVNFGEGEGGMGREMKLAA